MSSTECLKMERGEKKLNEYCYDWELIKRGSSLDHNRITRNLIIEIGYFLRGRDFEILPGEMGVSTPTADAYMYPDVSIICGKPKLEDDRFDTLVNPSVIFEILSFPVMTVDEYCKFFYYKEIHSFQEYIMIDSLKPSIQPARKQSDGSWLFENIDDVSAAVFIRTINFHLPIPEIYRGTEFSQ